MTHQSHGAMTHQAHEKGI